MESQKDTQKLVIGQPGLKAQKTEKLVTAIFMVTDLMDKAEPLRTELRSSSLKLLSESHASLISQIMSLINISTSIGLISDMNGNILSKELAGIKDSIPTLESLNFTNDTYLPDKQVFSRTLSQGQVFHKKNNDVLYKTKSPLSQPRKEARQIVSPGRRDSILNLIKDKREVTIKDISSQISDCSEKTIQRELISMLKDKVIEKTGEKRWSRYFLASRT